LGDKWLRITGRIVLEQIILYITTLYREEYEKEND